MPQPINGLLPLGCEVTMKSSSAFLLISCVCPAQAGVSRSYPLT
jgi:hypothetical protein